MDITPGVTKGHVADRAKILIVDDDQSVRAVLEEHLTELGYRATAASSAEEALLLLEESTPDLVLTDVYMGAMSGIELCKRLKHDARFQLTPVIILTGRADLEARVAGLAAGADDFFSKPFDFIELRTRVAALLRVKFLLDQLERAESVITTLGLTIEARDPYTGGHCERLSRYAVDLGQILGVPASLLKALHLGGFLHDVGKIAVPDHILLKAGPLDSAERAVMETHPVVGEELLRGMRTLDEVRPIVRHHHERMNGTGYPDGLRGDEIPLGARIMAVVDVYDALHTARPYKAALSHEAAVSILRQETEAGCWDPQITEAFITLCSDPAYVIAPDDASPSHGGRGGMV